MLSTMHIPGRLRVAAADTLFVVAAFGTAVLSSTRGLAPWLPPYARILIATAIAAPVLARRRAPLVVLAATTVVAAFAIVVGVPGGGAMIGVLVAAYTVAAYVPDAAMVAGAVAVLVSGVALGVAVFIPGSRAAQTNPGGLTPLNLLVTGLAVAVAWTTGYAIRIRRTYVADRAERAEREEGERVVRAVAEERLRIARELHDVIGHSISLIAIQSEAAARSARTNPDAVSGFLAIISSASREALTEMRHVLAVLRPERPDELRPQPDLAALPELADRIGAAGLPVRLDVPDGITVAPGVGRTAYRIVQEALTNTLKHAGAAHASVTVARSGDTLHVSVRDDGTGPSGTPSATAQGIVGMRERVALYGGILRVGGHPDGGFEVHATLPMTEEAG
ncbi:MAG TPA: sensor histidine kinase [Pseudonocardiaceae bacterium]|nr:sensor histidine kinase [Pseudonocardiaceae bacterium]